MFKSDRIGIALLLCVGVWAAWATGQARDGGLHLEYNTPRYVIEKRNDFRRDTWLLDTKLGEVYQMVEGADGVIGWRRMPKR